MKKYLLVFLVFSCFFAKSQDSILFNNGTILKCRIISQSEKNFTYKVTGDTIDREFTAYNSDVRNIYYGDITKANLPRRMSNSMAGDELSSAGRKYNGSLLIGIIGGAIVTAGAMSNPSEEDMKMYVIIGGVFEFIAFCLHISANNSLIRAGEELNNSLSK